MRHQCLPTLPKAGWLLTVYCRDVLSLVEEVKAYITSTFGSVLKIDSTKKVKYYKQINYQAFISIVIFCLETPAYHEYDISSIPESTPPSAQLKKYSSCYSSNCYNNYAPINVNPVGGGGVRARGGDLTNFKIF